MKRVLIFSFVFILAVASLAGCKTKSRDKIDLSGIHTTAAVTEAPKETMAPATTAAETTEEATTAAQTTAAAVIRISTKIETYKTDLVSIQYPSVSNMSDAGKQAVVNEALKANATSFEATLPTGSSVNLKCKVVSADRKRICAVYTGTYTAPEAAYPVNVFFTNTIDLTSGKSLGFNDFSDGYTMAGYVMSQDCEFYNVSPEMKQALLDYRATQSLEIYTDLFNHADFPIKTTDETFPGSFSYTNQGILYFSIPVPHALGDYAIVKYGLDGK